MQIIKTRKTFRYIDAINALYCNYIATIMFKRIGTPVPDAG
jgi:hypothetical protein